MVIDLPYLVYRTTSLGCSIGYGFMHRINFAPKRVAAGPPLVGGDGEGASRDGDTRAYREGGATPQPPLDYSYDYRRTFEPVRKRKARESDRVRSSLSDSSENRAYSYEYS